MDYKQLGLTILELVGGKTNIDKLTHCATRLRFEFVDMSKVETDKIKKLQGVISVVEKGGQFQVVIGNEVQQAYRSIKHELGEGNQSLGQGKKNNKEKGSLLERFISVVSTTFTPMIPAITGAGMIKALLAVLTLTGVLSAESQTYYILDMIADAAFYFMPILLAYGAAIKFECSPILAITVAGVLLHPSWNSLVELGDPVSFFGVPVTLAGYASTVLPIIFTVWIMSYIERFADRISPTMIKFFTKPMITLLLTAPLALVIIGPAGVWLNDLVAAGAEIINGKASWLIPMLMGAFQPALVVTGTAWAMTPIATMQITTTGSEMINGPGMLASNIAQGAATLAVAFKTKNKELKQLASSAGVTALMGITEPSLYGVTLRLKRPLIAAMIGGGCAGVYAGIVGLVRYAFVSPGLAAIPAFIGENPMNVIHAIITCIIAFVVTFAIAYFMGFEDPVEEGDTSTSTDPIVKKGKKQSTEDQQTTNKIETVDAIYINSPLKGTVVPLSQVPDDVFAGGLLGQGLAIEPEEGIVTAPADGEIAALFDTKHAIAIRTSEGAEVLIHVGMDTVNLEGKHYEAHVKSGDMVKAGDVLITFDIEKIKALGYSLITPVIISNTDQYSKIKMTKETKVTNKDSLLTLTR